MSYWGGAYTYPEAQSARAMILAAIRAFETRAGLERFCFWNERIATKLEFAARIEAAVPADDLRLGRYGWTQALAELRAAARSSGI